MKVSEQIIAIEPEKSIKANCCRLILQQMQLVSARGLLALARARNCSSLYSKAASNRGHRSSS